MGSSFPDTRVNSRRRKCRAAAVAQTAYRCDLSTIWVRVIILRGLSSLQTISKDAECVCCCQSKHRNPLPTGMKEYLLGRGGLEEMGYVSSFFAASGGDFFLLLPFFHRVWRVSSFFHTTFLHFSPPRRRFLPSSYFLPRQQCGFFLLRLRRWFLPSSFLALAYKTEIFKIRFLIVVKPAVAIL